MNRGYLVPILFQLLMFLVSCSSDEDYVKVDDQNPKIELEQNHIRTDVNTGFTLKGMVSDKDGLKNILVKSSELYLNKNIDLIDLYDELLVEYDLDYKVGFNEDIHVATATVFVTVYDVLGNFTEEKVTVDFNADSESPVFVTVPQAKTFLTSSQSAINYSFDLEVYDNKELSLVTVEVAKLGQLYTYDVFPGDYTKFSTTINLEFPGSPEEYEIKISASDYDGNVTEYIAEVIVSDTPDYPKLYVVEGTESSLFSDVVFGVPMMVQRVDAFTYETGYYSTGNTEVRFLPQKTGFTPTWYGIDSQTNLIVAAKSLDDALPIVLNEVGYNKIRLNILTGEYSITVYTPTDVIPTDGFLSGITEKVPVELGLICPTNWWGHASWPLDNPQMLVQDINNPYMYKTEFDVAAGTSNVRFFIGPKSPESHPTWWFKPFYRWDDKSNPEANIKNDGQNPGNWSVSTGGTYVFEFDAHLLRSRLYLKR